MKRRLSLLIGSALFGTTPSAFAITDTEVNASIPFNFSNPGARSMGMGGAFLGLADDATAAYTNPSGLTQLVEPEVSVEVRHTNYSLPYANGGSATLDPYDPSGLHTTDANSSVNNLSFLSVVYPWQQWSFAAYRSELVNFENNFASTNQTGEPVTLHGEPFITVFPVTATSHLKIVDYGFSAAWKLSDRISLGAGVSYYDFNVDTLLTRLNFSGPLTLPGLDVGSPVNQQKQSGTDNAFGFNLGARFVLTQTTCLGFTYRRGPEFSYEATVATLASCDATGCGPAPLTIQADVKDVRFKVPDVYGVGFSWHPTDAIAIGFDADYIPYSQLTHGIIQLLNNQQAIVSELTVPNGTEIHLGGEYTFTQMTHPFSLRAGIWHDPRHSIEFRGHPDAFVDSNGNPIPLATSLATLYHGGQGAQTHVSAGFGWAFAKFEIDGAADFSDVTDIYSISAVYRF